MLLLFHHDLCIPQEPVMDLLNQSLDRKFQ